MGSAQDFLECLNLIDSTMDDPATKEMAKAGQMVGKLRALHCPLGGEYVNGVSRALVILKNMRWGMILSSAKFGHGNH